MEGNCELFLNIIDIKIFCIDKFMFVCRICKVKYSQETKDIHEIIEEKEKDVRKRCGRHIEKTKTS